MLHTDYPTDLENIIFKFCYDLTAEQINTRAVEAFRIAKSIPVPVAWKKLIFQDGPIFVFSWSNFLQTNLQPNTLETQICLEGVRKTLHYLNFTKIRALNTLAAQFFSQWCRHELNRVLKTWNSDSKLLVFYIQRLLTSVDLVNVCKKITNFSTFYETKMRYLFLGSSVPLLFYLQD